MASFFEPLTRLLRKDWKFGLWPLEGKEEQDLTIQDLATSLRATNGAVQALAEEMAMLRLPQDMTHDGQVEARNWCPNVAAIPPKKWSYAEFCSAGASNNPLSSYDKSGNIQYGLSHKFQGVVFFGQNPAHGKNVANGNQLVINGGDMMIINNAGDIVGLCAIGIVVSDIPARVAATKTMGSGSCYVQKLTGDVVSNTDTETVLNPHEYIITSGTYVVLGQAARVNGQKAWVIIEVDGTFEPMYAARNSTASGAASPLTNTTVVLDTEIHCKPSGTSVFELSSNVITIKKSGIYHFSWVLPFQPVSAAGYGGAWLEEGSTFIKGANSHCRWPMNSTEITATFTNSIDHIVDVSGGNKTYRLRFASTTGGNIDASDITVGGGGGGYARLDIHKVRSL